MERESLVSCMEASPVQKKRPLANELKQEIGGGKFQQGWGGGPGKESSARDLLQTLEETVAKTAREETNHV